MLESFKIQSQELRRKLKITVHLPNDYGTVEKEYPVFFLLDGQYFFNFIGEKTAQIDLKGILNSIDRDFILVSMSAPTNPDWRISELNPYYNGESEIVDVSLAGNFFDYIFYNLLPMLKQKYPFNGEYYIIAKDDAITAALAITYSFPQILGMMLFSPDFSNTSRELFLNLKEDINSDKKVYIYQGGKDCDTKNMTGTSYLYKVLEENGCNNVILDFYDDLDNSFDEFANHIEKGIKFMLD